MPARDQRSALRALTALATSQGGYFTAGQAEEFGYLAPHLSYHAAQGNFERTGRGIYRLPTIPTGPHDDLMQLWLWSRSAEGTPRGVFSHQTALSLHDLAQDIPSRIHMTVPHGFRKRAPRGCVLHVGLVASIDRQGFDAIPATTPLRTLRDLADDASFPTEQFRDAVRSAARRGLVSARERTLLLARRVRG